MYVKKYIYKKLFDKKKKMLQVNFIMFCIIHKILVFLTITKILKTLFKDYNRLLFF